MHFLRREMMDLSETQWCPIPACMNHDSMRMAVRHFLMHIMIIPEAMIVAGPQALLVKYIQNSAQAGIPGR